MTWFFAALWKTVTCRNSTWRWFKDYFAGEYVTVIFPQNINVSSSTTSCLCTLALAFFKLLLTGSHCSPHSLLSRGHYLPRTCPKWTAINWNLPLQMLHCEIWVLSCGFPLWKWVTEWKASLQCWLVCGPGTFCALYCIVCSKVFCLKVLANGKLVLNFWFLLSSC